MTSNRSVEIVVSLLLLALAGTLGYVNWRTGIGWDSTGPQPGYFPFYLSVILAGAALYGLVIALYQRNEANSVFVTRAQARRVMTVLAFPWRRSRSRWCWAAAPRTPSACR